MVASESWKEILETNGWSDEFLDSDGFKAALEESETQTQQLLEDLGLV